MHNKPIIGFGFRKVARIIKALVSVCYPSWPLASADNTDFDFDNSRYYAQRHQIIIYC